MTRIVFTRPGGKVTVAALTDEFIGKFPSEAAAITDFVATRLPPGASKIKTINENALPNRDFRDAWKQDGAGGVVIDMPLARDIHIDRMAVAHENEIARIKVEERKERLRSNATQADNHAATRTALEALDLSALATRMANAGSTQALSAIWPNDVPR